MADGISWADVEEKYQGLYPPEFWDWLVNLYPEVPGGGDIGTNLRGWFDYYQKYATSETPQSGGLDINMYLSILEARHKNEPDTVQFTGQKTPFQTLKDYASDLWAKGVPLGPQYPEWGAISTDYYNWVKRTTPQKTDENKNLQNIRQLGIQQQTEDFKRLQLQQEAIQANREAQWKMQPQETYEQYQARLNNLLLEPRLSDADMWLKKWEVGQAARGFGQPSSLQNYVEQKGNEVRELQTAFAQRQASLAEAEKAGDLQRAASILGDVQQISGELSKALTDYQTNPLIAEQQALAQQQMERNALGDEGGSYVPKAPPAPKWLPVFAPGQKAGQEITKEQIRTPDVGLWSRTPTSVKAGLQGYMNWTGQDYQDMLDQMKATLPQQVTRQGQWRPVRQRGY